MTREALRYEAIRGYFTTSNAPDGSVIDFIKDYERSESVASRGLAISEGFGRWGHDDFNIAVWKGLRLVSWDWMDEVVESAKGELGEIEHALNGETP